MGQVLHGSATTTEAVRRAIQHSQASLRALAKRYGINQKTVAKWKRRTSVADLPTGPKEPRSTVLSLEEEADRRRLPPAHAAAARRLPVRPAGRAIPHLTRSSLHRCLQRHGISRLPEVEGDKPARAEVQSLPDRLLPHRHCRSPDRAGQALPVGRDRSDVEVRLCRAARESARHGRRRLPPASHRSRALQDPHGADRQRHPVHDARHTGSARPRSRSHGTRRTVPRPCLRVRLRQSRHRPPADQAEAPVDERPGRADEPDHQGRDRQALPLRHHDQLRHTSPTSSRPTTSAAGSRP